MQITQKKILKIYHATIWVASNNEYKMESLQKKRKANES